jgi:hypothetical protein
MTTTVNQADKQPEFDHVKFIQECGSKSAAIRKLTEQGKTRREIADMLHVIYQHVRNVQITPVKKPKTK